MANISASISLVDKMTKPLQNITKSIGDVISSMENVDKATNKGFDTSKIDSAGRAVDMTNIKLKEISNNIGKNTEKQYNFNRSVNAGKSAMHNLLTYMKNIALTYMSIQGLKKVIDLSDIQAQTDARLRLIVDDGGSVDELKKKIFASAQAARASYQTTADVISKLGMQAGKAFKNNDELIAFAEQLNKNFVIAGTSASGIESTMYNLTQAMASGVLRGQDFNSVIQNAPQIIQNMADYMNMPREQMRKLAEEGKLSAEVVKNAMLAAAQKTNEEFEKIPMTFEQIWTSIKNHALLAFEPILQKLNEIANSQKFQIFVNNIIKALQILSLVAITVFDTVIDGVNFISDNWAILSPVIYGVVAALLAYHSAQLLVNAVSLVGKIITIGMAVGKGILAVATMVLTGATWAQTAAQYGLNAAMYACPVVWIILIIIAVIAAIYGVIAVINKLTGKTISATGVICGAFAVALAYIGNRFIALWNLVCDVFVLIYNLVATVANFIANVFKDPVGAVCRLFFGLANTVLGILQALASAIDTVFGSNLSGAVQGWRNNLSGWVDKKFGKGDEVMKQLDSKSMHLKRFEYGQAYNTGYQFGKGIDDKISGLSKFKMPTNPTNSTNFPKNVTPQSNVPNDLAKDVEKTAGNTGAIKDSVTATKEDLKYLRDIAEREVINRFTTAKITVRQTNNNKIRSGMDIDGIVDKLTNKVNEAMEIAAEGVHS